MSHMDRSYHPGTESGRDCIQTSSRGDARTRIAIDTAADQVMFDADQIRKIAQQQARDTFSDDPEVWKRRGHEPWEIEGFIHFNFNDIWRVYEAKFVKTYQEETERLISSGRIQQQTPAGPAVRILRSGIFGGTRLYELELSDPDYSGSPVRFEIQLGSDGETDLREARS